MLRLNEFLKTKRKGSMGCMLIGMLFILCFITITVYKMEERKAYYIKKTNDNAVILSLMAANVVDLYEYASTSEILYDACYTDAEGRFSSFYGNCSSAQFEYGTKEAYTKAKNRFVTAFLTNGDMKLLNGSTESFVHNNDPSKEIYNEIVLKEFKIYNVYKGHLYSYNGTTFTDEGTLAEGDKKTETGYPIVCSGLYVEIDYKISILGKQKDMKIKQFVDMALS